LMCAKNRIIIFCSLLDIWKNVLLDIRENVEWPDFFGPPCIYTGVVQITTGTEPRRKEPDNEHNLSSFCRSQHHRSTPKGTPPNFQPEWKKWLWAYKTGNISETVEDRAKVIINGLYIKS